MLERHDRILVAVDHQRGEVQFAETVDPGLGLKLCADVVHAALEADRAVNFGAKQFLAAALTLVTSSPATTETA